MASGIFALLDDIGSLMDDVATMSKVATKKTAGILGDDLAVNAEKATGFLSSREIPVLWAITKGSFLNKLIILPIAFLLSAYLPVAITVILILGGALGNLFDRIFYKAVPDFIDLHINNFHWFIFNIADIFITIGVICLILVEIFFKKKA